MKHLGQVCHKPVIMLYKVSNHLFMLFTPSESYVEINILFIENSFIMPVTLLHQWEDRDNTMTKNPNAGEHFEADWMNDFSSPVSFLISWVKTRLKTSP